MRRDRHVTLLITSGSGPAECQQAVAGILDVMHKEADLYAVTLDSNGFPTKHGLKSAVALLSGSDAETFAKSWRGTIQWRAKSTLRPAHKRANWFVGVFDLCQPKQTVEPIQERDVSFESFRAGGPGGQHQNTTDSAVRAIHKPSGLSAVAREERSQHRNKSLALDRLRQLMAARLAAEEDAQKSNQNRLHHALERGNPVRVFKGHEFRQERRG